MRPELIGSVSHVAFRAADPEACVEVATGLVGLRESERSGDSVFLTHGAPHHSLQYIAAADNSLDHMGFEVTSDEALAEIRRRVEAANLPVIDRAPEGPVADSFTFLAPEGFAIEVHTPMGEIAPPSRYTAAPNRLGHFNLNPHHSRPLQALFGELLGFATSDRLGEDGYFMRCNADHHAIAILPGNGWFHHQAWEVQSIADLGRVGDLLDERGERLLWGPVRHGIGRNIAAYFRDPAGAVIELFTDMERIEGDSETKYWDPAGDRWYSFWTDFRPPDFRDLGVPPAPPER
jgi:catechol 2,3-dioxygenase